MPHEITTVTIANFLIEQVESDVQDFGYLLIPNDERLNAEALSNIKKKFKQYCEDNDYEI